MAEFKHDSEKISQIKVVGNGVWQEVRKVGDWLVGRSWKVFLDSVWRERYVRYR